MALVPGLQASLDLTVGDADTASALGSGDVPVLGTPRLLALAEAATVAAVAGHLGDGRTSVGTRVELEHLRATRVGGVVRAAARVTSVDGRQLVFEVVVTDEAGQLVGRGVVRRVVVDRERFLARI